MTSTPTILQPDRLIPEVDSFRAIARRHSLPIGSPECVIPLPLRLSQDRSLRANVTELLRELQQADPDFSLPDALWLLLTAIGGSTGTMRDAFLDEAVDLTEAFLARIGGWPEPPTNPVTDLDSPPAHDPRPGLSTESAAAPLLDESVGPDYSSDSASAPSTDLPSQESLVFAEITRALTRLEQSTVNLRLHLDSIDQRLSRMEPLLESPPLPPSTPTAVIAPPTKASPPEAPGSERTQQGTQEPRDLVHRHDAPPATPPAPQSTHVPPSSTVAPPIGLRRDRFTAAMDLPGTRSSLYMDPTPPDNLSGYSEAHAEPALEESPELSVTLPQAENSVLLPAVSHAAQTAVVAPPPSPALPESPDLQSRSAEAPEHSTARHALDPQRPQSTAASATEQTAIDSPLIPVPALARAARSETNRPESESSLPNNGGAAGSAFSTQASAAPDPAPIPHLDAMGATEEEEVAEEEEQQTRSSIGPHVIGIISAVVVALALLLLFRDQPLHLRSGFVPSASAPSAGKAPANGGNSPSTPAAPSQTPQGQPLPAPPPSSPRSSGQSRPQPAVSGRVLGARASEQPTVEEQVFAAPTFVPERTMKARLISAAPPLYPQVVNSPRLHGDVTFEAIIDKNGGVDGLTPLGGERPLRDAAANAVREWRFQPYTVRGKPVQVRTILHVHVDPNQTSPR